jgi:hypothetical protein
VIERVHLEWRIDPTSPARIPEAVDHRVWWIICCDEGYSSSLAAASLQEIGLTRATDVIDGFRAWRAAGLPVVHSRDLPAPPLRPQHGRLIGSSCARCQLDGICISGGAVGVVGALSTSREPVKSVGDLQE